MGNYATANIVVGVKLTDDENLCVSDEKIAWLVAAAEAALGESLTDDDWAWRMDEHLPGNLVIRHYGHHEYPTVILGVHVQRSADFGASKLTCHGELQGIMLDVMSAIRQLGGNPLDVEIWLAANYG